MGSTEKESLWDVLHFIALKNKDSCLCILGDFNAVRDPGERVGKGVVFNQADARFFYAFIRQSNLLEIRTQGRKFTWYQPSGGCKSKLDRFLVNERWMQEWPDTVGRGLQRSVSDHCPIFLTTKTKNWGPKPFRFLNSWLSHPDFSELVRKTWDEAKIEGWSCFVFKEKLKLIKFALKEWNLRIYGNIEHGLTELKDELQELDIIDDTFGLDESETIRRNELRAKIILKSKEKCSLLQQKAKVKWVKEGDLDTSFYHKAIVGRRKKNEIAGLTDEGSWIEDPKIIKEKVKTFFENHFKKTPRVLPTLPGDFTAQKISTASNAELIKPFSEAEIKEAIWSCDGDKSPGPDGFNFNLYKVIAKVLANRMKKVMDSVTSAIAEASKKRKGRIIFKVDFAKAYDSVEWDFLDLMLERMNFEPLWRKWIRGCISSATTNILVNGSPSGERRGSMHSLISRAVEKELIQPAKVGNDNITISHLQYADETVFLMEDEERNAVAIKRILRVFQLLSGLAVNFKKYCLFGVGVEDGKIERMAAVLGCDVGSLPFNYLSIKVGSKGKKVADWNYLVEKLSFTYLPKSTVSSLNALLGNFLWGGGASKSVIAWVKWKVLCASKVEGGLGLKNIEWFNQALVVKWLWRYLIGRDLLWARIVRSIYGEVEWGETGLESVGKGRFREGWWPKIVSAAGGASDNWFFQNLKPKVGDGKLFKFWSHWWVGQKPLKFSFPRLYQLSVNKEAAICEVGKWTDTGWCWELRWRRELFERERKGVSELVSLVSGIKLCAGNKDGWTWKGDTGRGFSTKSAYEVIKEQANETTEVVEEIDTSMKNMSVSCSGGGATARRLDPALCAGAANRDVAWINEDRDLV
ncbi:uncharacterized protein LOC130990469 [Salvia miltiorrhiza]|uniref:uncharacterized protein LOC130990469 n=1 Tax=Salvia miltiorrhiza TaxID=226208 RepID=UPI0025ABFD24|nr:uncharacterized protein LOC130990469 [Salvia miltiorrhiza]